MLIDRAGIKDEDKLGGAPFLITKSDTVLAAGDNGMYPRGFIVRTGGTLTVWVEDSTNPGQTKKRDLGTVDASFTWIWGGIFGIASTNEAGDATTCDDIIGIP